MIDRPGTTRRLFDLYCRAADLPAREQERWLADLESEEPGMAGRLRGILAGASGGDASAFLDPQALRNGPAWKDLSEIIAREDSERTEQIGRYRILDDLGSGGMSFVYLAQRDDGPCDQRVALKIMRFGLSDEAAEQRFLQERQILASLQHPGIAHLLDGGVSEDGRPYLVMEYIDGLPIDAYARNRKSPLRERIQLMVMACNAVAHAHRRKIVHRDIKPGNVLVDGDGTVKLLDFGIAKLLEPESFPLEPAQTRTDVRLLTPNYATPEQLRGEQIGTASDVYQLGLLLYELLTECPAQKVEGLSLRQIERVVCETEPSTPSSVAKTAERRRALRGDLDAVILKAMGRDPCERYLDGASLADDLRRHLAGQQVRARRQVNRDRTVSVAGRRPRPWRRLVAALGGGALVIALIATAMSSRGRIPLLSETAEAGSIESISARAEGPSAEEAYLRGLYYQGRQNPEERAKAGDFFQEAVDRDPAHARAYLGLAEHYYLLSDLAMRPTEAIARAREALSKALELDETLAEAHATLGVIEVTTWNWSRAEQELRRAIELNPSSSEAHLGYSWYLLCVGRWEEALREAEIVVDLNPRDFNFLQTLGIHYFYTREFRSAIEEFERLLQATPDLAMARVLLGASWVELGEYEKGIPEMEHGLALWGDRYPALIGALGYAYGLAGRENDARSQLVKLEELSREVYVPAYSRAFVHVGLGETDKAFEQLELAYENHDIYLHKLKIDPLMDPLRSDPRLDGIIRRIGLDPGSG